MELCIVVPEWLTLFFRWETWFGAARWGLLWLIMNALQDEWRARRLKVRAR